MNRFVQFSFIFLSSLYTCALSQSIKRVDLKKNHNVKNHKTELFYQGTGKTLEDLVLRRGQTANRNLDAQNIHLSFKFGFDKNPFEVMPRKNQNGWSLKTKLINSRTIEAKINIYDDAVR
ncbi:hypothetical protein B4U79_18815 [Dinothrombium tinctorium]|uniref:Uncharacterized protein n=1 Tax=Dinothrombium tinctorium TaxID=1965070 RepID=A0A3S3P2D7_9ACAR|nr:hypothetical protein B4U79_18815 [Dinothrombium tinctorium]